MKKCTVVLDIDGTLGIVVADPPSPQENQITQLDALYWLYPNLQFFKDSGHLIFATRWHIIFPGTLELLRYLYCQGVEVAFYSAGLKIRNEIFVHELLSLALGKEVALSMTPQIISREDLGSSHIKNLTKISPDIANTIIVDDNIGAIAEDQLHHHLYFLSYATIDAYFFDSDLLDILKLNSIFYIAALVSRALEKTSSGMSLSHTLLNTLKEAKLPYTTRNDKGNTLSIENLRAQDIMSITKMINFGITVLQDYTTSPLARIIKRRYFDKDYTISPIDTMQSAESIQRYRLFAETESAHQKMCELFELSAWTVAFSHFTP